MLGKDLYNWTGALSNQLVQCTGYSKEGDGAKGMTFRMSPGSAQLSSLEKLISVPTANGGWAVPTGVPTSPPRTPQVEAAEDMIRRGYTFRDQGGKDLVWEGTGRAGPLWGGTPTHRRYSKPYPITCSHFTGMLMKGWEYSSTTYVVDESYATGWFIPLGNQTPAAAEIWQAHRQARLFYSRGDLWLSNGSDMERGDIVFFSQQNPEGQNDKVKAGTADAYFGNIYHVAQYLGDGKLLQAATPTSPTGVYEVAWSTLSSTTAWVARPAWSPPPSTRAFLWDGKSSFRFV